MIHLINKKYTLLQIHILGSMKIKLGLNNIVRLPQNYVTKDGDEHVGLVTHLFVSCKNLCLQDLKNKEREDHPKK